MYKLRSACVFLFFFPSYCALADTEFKDSIPVEIVEALFDTYQSGQFAVFSDIAEEFPNFSVPAEFTVVGSVYTMTTLRVVFETSLDESDAIQSIVEIFESQDWTQFPTYSPPTQQVGFISPRQFNMGRSQILCDDNLGYLTIRYSARDSGNYLTTGISLSRNRQQGGCEQQLAMQQASLGQMSRSYGLRQYLPRLEIPELQNSPRRNVFFMGGSSSSGNSVETEGVMTSDQDIEEVYRYFADQIEEQGWDLDSQVVGTLSST